LIEYLDKTGAILGIVLILFVLIYLLILFILMIRFLEQTRKMVERNFILRWEERIFDYLSTDKTPHDIIRLFNRYGYKYVLPFLRSYLLSLKGSDKDKLMKLITDTELFDYIHSQLKSVRKRKIVFGAYYLGLAKSDGAVNELKNKLKYNDEHVFVTCAMSLARINVVDALNDIFSGIEKFKGLTRDTFLSILLAYDDPVCDNLTKRLEVETSTKIISIIITTLRHFKYLAAAPTVMGILSKETNKELIIEILKYLGEVEYIDASKELEFYLQSPDPEIKTEAIKAVKKIGDTSLEDKIWELIKDENRNVKVSAAEALYEISDKSRGRLKNVMETMPDSLESSIARMIFEQSAIRLAL
jgi:HEAT repeat protein